LLLEDPDPMKVLVADDDIGTSYALARLLGGWGFEVQHAAHAEDVRAALDGDAAPPFAVLEHELAGGGGIELCRHVRRRERGAYTYVLIIGAIGDPALIQDVVEAGANDFLVKPFEIAELRRRMQAGRRLVEALASGSPVPLQDPAERFLQLRSSLEMAAASRGGRGRRTLQPRIAGRRRAS
jgi:DNA-binding response OmpR family regulator